MPSLPPIEQEVLIRFKSDTRSLKRGANVSKDAFKQIDAAANKTARSMSSAALAGEQIGRIGQALPGQLGPIAGVVGGVTGAFRSAEGRMLAFGLALTGVIGAVVKFGPVIAEWASELLKVDDALGVISGSMDEVLSKQRIAVESAAARTLGILPGEAAPSRTTQAIEEERTQRVREANLKLAERQLLIAKSVSSTELGSLELRRAMRETAADIVKINERAAQQAEFVLRRQTEANRERRVAAEAAEEERKKRGAAQREELANARELLRLSAEYGAPFFGGNERVLPGAVGGTTFLEPGGPGQRAEPRIGAVSVSDELPGAEAIAGGQAFLEAEKLRELTNGMTEFGSATEQVAEAAIGMRDGFLDAFESIGSGQGKVLEILGKFTKQAVANVLRTEAEKQFALGVAEAITLNPHAALRFAAAASLAAAAGAIGGGGGGAGGASRGGGGLPGAAAGAFAGQAGGRDREVILIESSSHDDDPRGRRRRLRSILDRADAELGSSDQIARR